MISFTDAKLRILEKALTLPEMGIEIEGAAGLVLARDVMAPISLPPFDNSAMDGFAIALDHNTSQTKFPITQTIRAGDFPQALAPGSCAKIMTGAPLPSGATAVIPVEDAATCGNEMTPKAPVAPGQYVRRAGEDVRAGDVVAKRGDEITVRCVALFAALGLTRVPCFPRPRAAIVTTGSELAERGRPLKPGKIYDCNSVALRAALAKLGISPTVVSAQDSEDEISDAMLAALDSGDILIAVGGVSVGEFDFVKGAFARCGIALEFWRVAMKPGKPFFFGTAGRKLVFGLPGNPVSCMATFDLLARPAILKMMGRRDEERQRRRAVAGETLTGQGGVVNFLRGKTSECDGQLVVKTSGPQGSAQLKAFADADCMIVIPEGKESVKIGEEVEILIFD